MDVFEVARDGARSSSARPAGAPETVITIPSQVSNRNVPIEMDPPRRGSSELDALLAS